MVSRCPAQKGRCVHLPTLKRDVGAQPDHQLVSDLSRRVVWIGDAAAWIEEILNVRLQLPPSCDLVLGQSPPGRSRVFCGENILGL